MSYGGNQGYQHAHYGQGQASPQNQGFSQGYGHSAGQNASQGYGPAAGQPPNQGFGQSAGQNASQHGPPAGQPPNQGFGQSAGHNASQYGPPAGQPPNQGFGHSTGQPPNQYSGGQSAYQAQAPPPGRPPPQGSAPQPTGGSFRPRPPTIRIDPQLRQWFAAVDRDNSGNISAVELQQALVNGDWTPFDLDTVKMLMNIFDTDRSGTIGFDEFAGLWKYIKDWQGVFRHFDADRSGTIAGNELRNALDQFGFKLSPYLLQMLQRKYGTGSLMTQKNPDGGITFDRFVRCCVVVKSLTEAFQRVDTDQDGWVQISYEQFMQMVLEAP